MSTQSRVPELPDVPDAGSAVATGLAAGATAEAPDCVPPATKLACDLVPPDSDPASIVVPPVSRSARPPFRSVWWRRWGKRDGDPTGTRRAGAQRYGRATRQPGGWRYGRIAARWRRWRAARFTGLWRRPDFVKLWAGQTISNFGTLITGVALPLTAIYALHATPAEVALLAAANVAPGLALGLFAGVWVDRLRRRPIMIAADLGRALALGSVPVAALLGALHIEQLYAVALLTSALTVCFESAYPAYLPSLLARDELVEGNSKLTASASVAEVAGFGLGGALVQTLTGPLAIGVDALTYVYSAITLLLIRQPEPAPAERDTTPTDAPTTAHAVASQRERAPGDHAIRAHAELAAHVDESLASLRVADAPPMLLGQSADAPPTDATEIGDRAAPAPGAASLWRELAVGLRYTLGTPIPRALAGMSAITRMCGSIVEVVLALYLVHALHLPPLVIGLIWGVGGATSFVGAALAQRIIRRLGIGRAIVWSVFVASAFTIFLPLAGGPFWLVVALMALQQFGDAAYTLNDIGVTSVLQAQTPPNALGRLHATIQVIQGAAILIGLALGGALGQAIGLRPTLVVAALGMLLAPLLVALSPVRRLRTVADGAASAARDTVAATGTVARDTSVSAVSAGASATASEYIRAWGLRHKTRLRGFPVGERGWRRRRIRAPNATPRPTGGPRRRVCGAAPRRECIRWPLRRWPPRWPLRRWPLRRAVPLAAPPNYSVMT